VGLEITCFSLHNNKEKTERTLANYSFSLSQNKVCNRFENRALKAMFGRRRKEETGG
jgi:hypothetical protein